MAALFLTVLLVPLYLLGMFRSQGVDIANYLRSYHDISNSLISDPGYNSLMILGKQIGLSFEAFLLACGILILALYQRVARHFRVPFGIVLFVLMSHLIVVRDFSQFRVGLAIAVSLFSYTLPGPWKFIGYFYGGTIHFTSLVISAILFYYEYFLENRQSTFRIAIPFAATYATGSLLGLLSSLDPRIALYMAWDREGYGAAVSTWVQPLFVLFLLLSHQHFVRSWQFKFDAISFSLLIALAIFFSFSDTAIFSFRLTNVAISLYPISAALVLYSNRSGLEKIGFFVLLLGLLSLRENTDSILEAIVTGLET